MGRHGNCGQFQVRRDKSDPLVEPTMRGSSTSNSVAIIGEVLFDHFPDGGKVLGGAPFNVAWNLAALGVDVTLVSAVGDDVEGTEVIEALQQWGLSTQQVKVRRGAATGSVNVSFEDNEPSFHIADNQAYDHLCVDPFETVPEHPLHTAGVIYHGSLALRHANNRAVLKRIDDTVKGLRFVDLNIRKPWWDLGLWEQTIGGVHWLKLSGDELQQISGKTFQTDSIEAIQAAIASFESQSDFETPVHYLVTCGSGGAYWVGPRERHFQPVEPIKNFVDAVGAGDAFAAAAIAGIIKRLPPKKILAHAVRYASKACTIRGATTFDRQHYGSSPLSDP